MTDTTIPIRLNKYQRAQIANAFARSSGKPGEPDTKDGQLASIYAEGRALEGPIRQIAIDGVLGEFGGLQVDMAVLAKYELALRPSAVNVRMYCEATRRWDHVYGVSFGPDDLPAGFLAPNRVNYGSVYYGGPERPHQDAARYEGVRDRITLKHTEAKDALAAALRRATSRKRVRELLEMYPFARAMVPAARGET